MSQLKKILKSFDKTLGQLQSMVYDNVGSITRNEKDIVQMEKNNKSLQEEADEATAIIANIKKLLNKET